MEFAGNKYIYLSKLKKDKIRKIRQSENENKDEAPVPKIENKQEFYEQLRQKVLNATRSSKLDNEERRQLLASLN